MHTISVRKLSKSDPDLNIALAIRKAVFVDEQHCPADIEYQNDDVSTHFLATCNGDPCGAARWRQTENGYKLERFAVLPAFRKKGVGVHLVEAVLADLPPEASHIYLNAQLTAVDFYVPLGFRPVGDQFNEAGIKHQQMVFSGRTSRPGL